MQLETMCNVIEAELARRKVTARVTGGEVTARFELDVSRVPAGLSHLAGDLAHRFKAQRCAIRCEGERRLVIEVG